MKKGAILVNILLFVFTSISISEIQIPETNSNAVFYCESHESQSSENSNALLSGEESEEETESRVRIQPVQYTTIKNEKIVSVSVSKNPFFLSLLTGQDLKDLPLSLRAPPV